MPTPRTFKSDAQTDPTKAMKIPKPVARFPAACAQILFLLAATAPCGSSAYVQATVQWVANTTETLAAVEKPGVLQDQLRNSMASVYVAASLPADSAVNAAVDMPVEQVYIIPPPSTAPPPSTSPPSTPPPSGGGGGSGGTIKTTTSSAPRPAPQDSNSGLEDDGGNSVLLAASLAVGGVGLIGVAVWAFARKGPKPEPQPCSNPPVIPEKIVRPAAPPIPPPPQPLYPPQPTPPPLYPPPPPPQTSVAFVPQVVYYTPPPPPPQMPIQPVIPVNIDRAGAGNGPTYRVFART